MSRVIRVDTSRLASTSQRVASEAAEYRQLYERLYQEVAAMSKAWQGKDNLALTTQINGFRDDFDAMAKYLDEFAAYVSNAARTYEEAQGEVLARARQLVG